MRLGDRGGPECTDVGTLLLLLGDRLLALGSALRGLRTERSDEDSIEGRVERGIAGDLEGIAMRIDAVRARLCPSCGLLDVVEGLRVGRGTGRGGHGRARKSD